MTNTKTDRIHFASLEAKTPAQRQREASWNKHIDEALRVMLQHDAHVRAWRAARIAYDWATVES